MREREKAVRECNKYNKVHDQIERGVRAIPATDLSEFLEFCAISYTFFEWGEGPRNFANQTFQCRLCVCHNSLSINNANRPV